MSAHALIASNTNFVARVSCQRQSHCRQLSSFLCTYLGKLLEICILYSSLYWMLQLDCERATRNLGTLETIKIKVTKKHLKHRLIDA
jgi:hypothetical protein